MSASRRISTAIAALLVLSGFATSFAHAVPATDLRSGTVNFDSNGGLTTVPLFVVPSGSRFVLTDFSWTPGFYPGQPPVSLTAAFGVWIQDNSNNVRWYVGSSTGSSTSNEYNATPHVSWSSGLVFEPNVVVQVGVSQATGLHWTANWSGYLESVSVSAVDGPPGDALGLEAFPNPSGSKVVLQFRLAHSGKTTLAIYDAKGRKIRSLEESVRAEGWNAVEWDGRDDRGRAVRAGTYFARLETPESATTEKLIQMK